MLKAEIIVIVNIIIATMTIYVRLFIVIFYVQSNKNTRYMD